MPSFTRLFMIASLALSSSAALAAKLDLAAPPGSVAFGRSGTVLPNGNIVVIDAAWDPAASGARLGAVHLYDAQGARIATLRGTAPGDTVGSGGITVLANGSFVVASPDFNGSAGAVTFVDGARGLDAAVSAANSLVGARAGDRVGAVFALAGGDYVVVSRFWSDAAGAATWGSGTHGVAGAISAANSLVGAQPHDEVGSGGVVALANGAYVVKSPGWHDADELSVGAVTWGAASGVRGVVGPSNSLVGAHEGDEIGGSGVLALANGAYVVNSRYWDNGAIADAGAVTFGRAAGGATGVVSAANSLVGTHADDQLGGGPVVALDKGHYVVGAPGWHDGALATGAALWCDGSIGCAGALSRERALVGAHAGDAVGASITALRSGHYVVASPAWSGGTGAATWRDGKRASAAVVSSTNSLVGAIAGDRVGSGGVAALANGHYVVSSPHWGAEKGATTWGDGARGTSGVVTSANSIVGARVGDHVGRVVPLALGDYAVCSGEWDDGAIVDAGAVTWAKGSAPAALTVSPLNSLAGSAAHDAVGAVDVVALANGNYVVPSPRWSNGAVAGAGAATWGAARAGVAGRISSSNSIVGTQAGDHVGQFVAALPGGGYAVATGDWDDLAAADAGAVAWIDGTASARGMLTSASARIGALPADRVGADGVHALPDGNYWFRGAGGVMLGRASGGTVGTAREDDTVIAADSVVLGYDLARGRLVIGLPGAARVTSLEVTSATRSALSVD